MPKTIPQELEAAGFHIHSSEIQRVVPAVLYLNDSDEDAKERHQAGDVRYPEKRYVETMIWGSLDDRAVLVYLEDGKFLDAIYKDRNGMWFTTRVTWFREWLKGDGQAMQLRGLIASAK